jgi:hypothetical protein
MRMMTMISEKWGFMNKGGPYAKTITRTRDNKKIYTAD